MKKGIIFDVDGTLWDSSKQVAESWDLVVKKRLGPGFSLTKADLERVMGLPMDLLSAKLFPQMEEGERLLLAKECMVFENDYLLAHPGTLYGGIEEALSRLKEKGYFLAVLSNAQIGYIEALFASTGLGKYFSDHLSWGDHPARKGENMLLIKERNGLGDCLYVGDTAMDEEESRFAKMKFIYCAYGFGKAKAPDATVHSPSELPIMVESLI